MKKGIAALLAVLLLLAALPVTALADGEQNPKGYLVAEEAERVYKKCKQTAGKSSFAGFCGLMTSHQLYNMGINDTLIICDGNKQYDYYKNMEMTSSGYSVKAYAAPQYTLLEALNTVSRNGNKDVYNLLVGFQWTNTDAGAQYGHAVIVNAILDGTVYFVESFNYCFGSLACKEGKTLTCSIQEFADYFDSWTKFEGIIYFGEKQYSAACQLYGTNVFLRTRFESTLRSQPCLVGENNCQSLRAVAAGEVLHATAVCKNPQGELFYQVKEGELTGYISANAVSFLEANREDLSLEGADIPETASPGQDLKISGNIASDYANVVQVGVSVTNADGETVLTAQLDTEGTAAELEGLNESLEFEALPEGSYQLSVWATGSNVLVKDMGFITEDVTCELLTQTLVIGAAEPLELTQQEEIADGWFFENGTWYCYEDGQPCTGWATRFGVDYYLQDTGAVTTGLQELDGWQRYFSTTGAMCIGWVTTQDGAYYWISDGVYATGWQRIGDSWYLFGEDGLLIKEGTAEEAE